MRNHAVSTSYTDIIAQSCCVRGLLGFSEARDPNLSSMKLSVGLESTGLQP